MIKKILFVFLIIFICISAYLTAMSNINVPDKIDKLCHFTAFSTVAACILLVYLKFFKVKFFNWFLFGLVYFGGLTDAVIEITQSTNPVRTCDGTDWIFGLAGLSFSGAIVYLWNFKKENDKIYEKNQE
jgi:VanZ family protein